MSAGAYTIETCPNCAIEFKGSAVSRPGLRNSWKQCPNGHWTTVSELSVYRRMRVRLMQQHSDKDHLEIYKIWLDGFYKITETLPKSSIANEMIQAVLSNAAKLTERALSDSA